MWEKDRQRERESITLIQKTWNLIAWSLALAISCLVHIPHLITILYGGYLYPFKHKNKRKTCLFKISSPRLIWRKPCWTQSSTAWIKILALSGYHITPLNAVLGVPWEVSDDTEWPVIVPGVYRRFLNIPPSLPFPCLLPSFLSSLLHCSL